MKYFIPWVNKDIHYPQAQQSAPTVSLILEESPHLLLLSRHHGANTMWLSILAMMRLWIGWKRSQS